MLRPSILAVILFAPLTVALPPTISPAADPYWPGWRGPGRDGWVSDFQPPAPWPDKLERKWQVDVGLGYGSPVVAAGRVYQHAREGDEEVVWCLDVATGDVVWRKSYPAPFTIGSGAERHGKGPKSSPALADGRLFTLSITGVLSAWDAKSGELLWRRDYDSEFGQSHPYWGAATSPLVIDDRVVVHIGTDHQGALVALHAASGEEIWRHGGDGASYASPILVEIAGVRQIIELNMRALVSVDSDTGRLLWEYPYPQESTNQNMITPVYHDGLLLVGGENRGIRAIEPRMQDGQWNVTERWHQQDVALDMSSAVINEELLFGFSHFGAGRIFCLNPADGKVLWQGPGRAGENVAFLSIPGYIVALISTGELRIIKANGDRYEVAASYRVADDPSTWAPPVLLPDGILVKDKETLSRWSLGTSTGR